MSRRFATQILALLALGASSAQAQSPSDPVLARRMDNEANPHPATIRRSHVIEVEEIVDRAPGATAMEVVRQLRPEYLRRNLTIRGNDPSDDGYAVVYLNGVRLGSLRYLETIPAEALVRIRFLRASEAGLWAGREHRSGIIAVTTSR